MRSRALCSAQTTVFPRKMLVFRLEALYAAADLVFITPRSAVRSRPPLPILSTSQAKAASLHQVEHRKTSLLRQHLALIDDALQLSTIAQTSGSAGNDSQIVQPHFIVLPEI